MEIHGFVVIVGYQDDGIRVGGQHGQHGTDSAVAGEELAKFAGFIDDKGLVGQLPQFQLTEYDTHDVRVTVVKGNRNQINVFIKNKAGRQDQFVFFNPGDAFRIVNYIDAGNGISQTVLISIKFQIIDFRAV